VSRQTSGVRAVAAGANLAIEAATAEIVRAFGNGGVRSIVLKGPALVRWLYADEGARSSTDVDVLVSPRAFDRAEEVLMELGYELRSLEGISHDRPWNAHTWHGPRGIGVDLHRALVGVGASPDDAWHVLTAELETMRMVGTPVEVLGPTARALHVALHAAQHGIRYPKALSDLERALELLPPATWRHAAELAVRLDAVPAFSAGLRLLPAGAAFVDSIALSKPETVEAVLLASSPPQTAGGFEWLARVPGVRAKTQLMVRKLFPPRPWLRAWSPLARRGTLGLVAAYAWRPLWVLLHAGPGFLAWRRARRRARSAA
jgi:Uncharacterised nucleotidyltransferase